MGKQHVLFLSSLLAAVLVLGGYTAVKAQQKGSSAAAKRWSDAATWPDKKVPGKDAVVTIAKDMNVVLDVLLDRSPHAEAAAAVWAMVEKGEAEGLLAAHCVTTLHDLASRARGQAFGDQCVSDVLSVFAVAGTGDKQSVSLPEGPGPSCGMGGCCGGVVDARIVATSTASSSSSRRRSTASSPAAAAA